MNFDGHSASGQDPFALENEAHALLQELISSAASCTQQQIQDPNHKKCEIDDEGIAEFFPDLLDIAGQASLAVRNNSASSASSLENEPNSANNIHRGLRSDVLRADPLVSLHHQVAFANHRGEKSGILPNSQSRQPGRRTVSKSSDEGLGLSPQALNVNMNSPQSVATSDHQLSPSGSPHQVIPQPTQQHVIQLQDQHQQQHQQYNPMTATNRAAMVNSFDQTFQELQRELESSEFYQMINEGSSSNEQLIQQPQQLQQPMPVFELPVYDFQEGAAVQQQYYGQQYQQQQLGNNTQEPVPSTSKGLVQIAPQGPQQNASSSAQQKQAQSTSQEVKVPKKRGRKAKNPEDQEEEDAICPVCKERAGKHSYYGGRVCPSCRAFFRRAVQSKYYEIFFCSKGENCEISLKTRRSCQYCRFKKCLDAGMRIAWVLPDGERNRRFNKLTKYLQRNDLAGQNGEGSNSGDGYPTAAMVPVKVPNFRADAVLMQSLTDKEIEVVYRLCENLNVAAYTSIKEFVSVHPDFLKQLATMSYFGGHVTYDFFRLFNQMCSKKINEMYLRLDETKQLSFNDRKTLQEKNGSMMHKFNCSVTFEEPENCFSKTIDVFTKSGEFPFMEELNSKLTEMNLEGRKPEFKYDQLYPSPWAKTLEDEDRFYKLMLQMKSVPREDGQTPVDPVHFILMKLIIAFCPDFIQLERRDLVERMQLKYVGFLQKYLSRKYKDRPAEAARRLARSLMVTSWARESDEIMERRLPV